MKALQNQSQGITRDVTYNYPTSCGISPDTLASFDRKDETLWKLAIDEMLGWKGPSNRFGPGDQPAAEVLDTAIDYAMDQIREGGAAPASIVPSGSGRVAMEWSEGPITVIVEFTGLGVATYTQFDRRCMVARNALHRNPRSRKLELQG